MQRVKRVGTKVVAFAGAAILGFTAFSPAAAAAVGDQSHAKARFLSGSAGTFNFDQVAALKGVAADQKDNQKTQTEANPLKGSLLGQQLLNLPGGLNLPLEKLIKLGAVNQYAQASPKGKSRAASGAVANGGGINTTNNKKFPANATLDLTSVLPAAFTNQVANLKLDIGAVSAVADLDAAKGQKLAVTCKDLTDPKQCRDYQIAGAHVHLSLPILKTLFTQLKPVTDTLSLDSIDANTLCNAIPGGTALAPLCNILGNNPLLTITAVPPNLDNILDSATSIGSGKGLEIDLQNGTVDIDLAKLLKSLGLDLNNLPPNTELVQYIIKGLATVLPGVLQDTVTGLTDQLQAELEKAAVTVTLLGGAVPPITLSGATLKPLVDPLVDTLKSTLSQLTDQLQKSLPDTSALAPLGQLLSTHANVQDSPSKGVFRETALKIELLKAAGKVGTIELDLARARVGANTVGSATPKNPKNPKNTPNSNPPGLNRPPAGPNLPNTGANALDLPFLLLGLGLVTGGAWIIMYGRAEALKP